MTGRLISTHRRIAAEAGVSVSTVDRVLNERGHVSADKASRVAAAARALGFGRAVPEPWHAIRRIQLILPANPTPHWAMLTDAFRAQAALLPRHTLLQRTLVPEGDIAGLVRSIRAPAGVRHALIVAGDAAAGISPALRDAQAGGEIVVTLTTEIPGFEPTAHSGIDNVAVGRTAAHLLLGMCEPGEEGAMLVLANGGLRAEHRQRIEGFHARTASRLPVRVAETGGNPARAAALVREAMAGERLFGVYDCSTDSAEVAAVMRALERRPRWIAHERSALHRACLADGSLDFILDQDAAAQAAYALFAIRAAAGTGEVIDGALRPELRILCRENLRM